MQTIPLLKMTNQEFKDLQAATDLYGYYNYMRIAYYLKNAHGYSIPRAVEMGKHVVAQREEMDASDAMAREAQKGQEFEDYEPCLSVAVTSPEYDYPEKEYQELPDDLSQPWLTGEGM